MSYDVEQLRRDEFPWAHAHECVYMNAASTGPMPERSIRAVNAFTRERAQPQYLTFERQFGALDESRTLIGRLINASTSDIALTTNTGAGINLAAWGLPLGAGDEVVVSDGEFPANMYPWMAASRARGFALHVVPMRDGVIDNDALLEATSRPRVRVLSVSWVGFSSGAMADVQRLGAACRSRGILLVVDGIQAVGTLPIDVTTLPVDMLACGGQKWLLAPWGTGFTYVRPDVLPLITPQPVSWMAVRDSDDFSRLVNYDLTWRNDARRFEQVTLPYQDFIGLVSSLTLLHELGPDAVAGHIHRCAEQLLVGAQDIGMATVTPVSCHAGIASVRPKDAVAASRRLNDAKVIHSVREGTIRLAPHCYTNAGDIVTTLAALAG
ncbi:MAG: aminotransferase class V-fold PLP-dependent enzyme [bacterium]